MPGIDAPEGLASYSSDGVPLSINFLPLPAQNPEVIRLDVEAASSGNITLKRTELDSIPSVYSVWLVDRYKKDSIDLRVDSNYVFYINKADTATFGSYRFTVVVSKTPAAAVRLLGFNAIKATDGAQILWTTKNEGNGTHFDVERSCDGGTRFEMLDSLISTSAGAYSFTDNNPANGLDKYRLKITDLNGTVSYSNEVTLIFGGVINTVTQNMSIYPNPTNGMLNLTINQNTGQSSVSTLTFASISSFPLLAASAINVSPLYNIRIINITGCIVKTATSSSPIWQDDVSALSPGTYIIQVVNQKGNTMVGKSTFIKM
jgi:hypothetical protein